MKTAYILILIIAGLLIIPGCSSKKNSNPYSEVKMTFPDKSGTVIIMIKNDRFVPDTVKVHTGTKVQWINYDLNTQSVVSDDTSFSSGPLGKGDSYNFTFNAKGAFSYSSEYAIAALGTVVVED